MAKATVIWHNGQSPDSLPQSNPAKYVQSQIKSTTVSPAAPGHISVSSAGAAAVVHGNRRSIAVRR